MELLLTTLSGLALWVFLALLVAMLGRIRAALERIHVSLAKIAMGVRAIESETAILKAELPTTVDTLAQLSGGAEVIAAGLASAERRLAEALR
ncbi:MAG: hypothetical protein HY691_04265 [Chloroflexi bacterium]|nr:hypothetical protein [Chloroflexota bacterium]